MNCLSLFSCAGVGEYYLKELGVNVVVANELIEKRAMIYTANYPETNMIVGDITDEKVYENIINSCENIELIIATPPCQGMSVAGKMDENDPRNSLIKSVFRAVKDLNPEHVLIENVPSFLKHFLVVDGKRINSVDYLKQLNYVMNYKVVDAADYGTPQTRKRAIVLMSKNKKWEFPEKQAKITVRDAISHLPSLESGQSSEIKHHTAKVHNANHILWMRHTPTGKTAFDNKIHYPKTNGRRIKGYSTTYKRMEWDIPSFTITTCNGAISSQNNVHPGRLKSDGTYSDARVLTILELLLLTGLDENWVIPKNASDNLVRTVIGESVPPRLIYHLVSNL